MQLVNLMEGGQRARMSKRQGEFVTLDDLLDDIGVDAARWFLASRSHDTTLDVDLELARSESQDNPVYYVQYAHARIASILRKAGDVRVEQALAADLRASSERFSFAIIGPIVQSRSACSLIAAITFGCWCPSETLTSCEAKSR